jgi:ATP-dependent protease HslVU (ClpYQ) ATPase subunit
LLEKQQFSCNKFRKPKNLDENVEMHVKVGPVLDHESPTEEEKQEAEIESVLAEIAEKGGKKKDPKMRKRENIIHTNCKAKLVVKLIDGRWEVMTFIPEHNHPPTKRVFFIGTNIQS